MPLEFVYLKEAQMIGKKSIL